MLTALECVQSIIPADHQNAKICGSAFAPSNIALIKYWGKRNESLNLPMTDSLSISLGTLGSHARISRTEKTDLVFLNGASVDETLPFFKRAQAFLNLFRPQADFYFKLEAKSNIPIAAGLASSASGFASIVLALNDFFNWQLETHTLSILARLGSGSAARSIEAGFIHWHQGKQADGLDSFATRIENTWPELRIGLLIFSEQQKEKSSRLAMKESVLTSPFYKAWPACVANALPLIKAAILAHDFKTLGQIAEQNALAMHACMQTALPPTLYALPETITAMHRIWQARAAGLPLYFTQDAGPNLKLLYLQKDTDTVAKYFPNRVEVIPFD